MKKKVLAVVTAAVLALGCFASVSAATSFEWVDKKGNETKSETIASITDWKALYKGINDGSILINHKKANPSQKKAIKAIRDDKIFSYGNDSLDYPQNKDDYLLEGIQWTFEEKLIHLTHLYSQAGTEKVIRIFQITADEADSSNPVTVKIVDSDVKASKSYGLRHFKDGVWDNTAGKVTSVVNGVVTAQITDASPFALVEVTKKDATDATKDAAAKAATGTKTAPKTGEV